MAQAYCSAPGWIPQLYRSSSNFFFVYSTSVDAEHAFSTGRCHVNHMQHNMSSQTFKAWVALDSWAKSPIFPKFSDIAEMVASHMGQDEEIE
jgi:hypothetical protein